MKIADKPYPQSGSTLQFGRRVNLQLKRDLKQIRILLIKSHIKRLITDFSNVKLYLKVNDTKTIYIRKIGILKQSENSQ